MLGGIVECIDIDKDDNDYDVDSIGKSLFPQRSMFISLSLNRNQ